MLNVAIASFFFVLQHGVFLQDANQIQRHFRLAFVHDGLPGNQDDIHWSHQGVLNMPEGFPQQSPRTISVVCLADSLACDDTQSRAFGGRVDLPIGDQAPTNLSLPRFLEMSKFGRSQDALAVCQAKWLSWLQTSG